MELREDVTSTWAPLLLILVKMKSHINILSDIWYMHRFAGFQISTLSTRNDIPAIYSSRFLHFYPFHEGT